MLTIDLPCSVNKFFLYACQKCTALSNELYYLFYPYVTYGDCSQSKYDIVFDVEENTINIINNGEIHCHYSYTTTLEVYKTIVRIVQENIILKENYCFLHGATVTYGKNAYLLLAESQMGKSTLCMYLHTKNEFECIGDDLAIINTQNFQINPVSKYIHIRKSALSLIDANEMEKITYNSLIDRYQYPLNDSRFNSNFVVKGIFILDRQNFANSVSRINCSYNEILYNSYLPFQLKNNIKSALVLSKSREVWQVKYFTLEQAYQHIKQLCT